MIYQAKDYLLRKIGEQDYLIPLAQRIVQRSPLLKVNDVGADIWRAVGEGVSPAELLSTLADEYEIESGSADFAELRSDVRSFLQMLERCGAIRAVPPAQKPAESFDATRFATTDGKSPFAALSIADLRLELFSEIDTNALTAEELAQLTEPFSDFLLRDGSTEALIFDQTIVLTADAPEAPRTAPLIDDPLLTLYAYKNGYLYHHPANETLTDMFVSHDGVSCVMFLAATKWETLAEEFFFALRESFLLLAGLHEMYCLHSASIAYEGKALLFAGPSGMGKSTHTGLWNTYAHTTTINGDLNLLAIEDGAPVIKGIPWCGTSGIYDTKTHPVRAVTLLARGDNTLIPLSADEKIAGVFQRITSPRFTRDMTSALLDFTERFCALTPVHKLACDISEKAVDVIRAMV